MQNKLEIWIGVMFWPMTVTSASSRCLLSDAYTFSTGRFIPYTGCVSKQASLHAGWLLDRNRFVSYIFFISYERLFTDFVSWGQCIAGLLVRVSSSNAGSNPARSKQTMLLYPDATKLPGSWEPDVQGSLLEKAKSRDFYSDRAVMTNISCCPLPPSQITTCFLLPPC